MVFGRGGGLVFLGDTILHQWLETDEIPATRTCWHVVKRIVCLGKGKPAWSRKQKNAWPNGPDV